MWTTQRVTERELCGIRNGEMMLVIRHRRAALLSVGAMLVTIGSAHAIETTTCRILETGGIPPGMAGELAASVQIENGTVQRLTLTRQGMSSTTELMPFRRGFSMRMQVTDLPSGIARGVFSLVVIDSEGEVRTDFWVRDAGAQASEGLHIWTRLQC